MNNTKKWNANDFYPTPEKLLDKITDGIEWRELNTILEPSAGKGNIVDYLKSRQGKSRFGYYSIDLNDIDCIELDSDLQKVLKGKGYRVVHDDFLTFKTFKHYDLIIMNPPFSNGVKHLLHALEIQKDGGAIICILNAESLKNLYNNERKALIQKLDELNASIEYMQNEFSDSEHSTDVEIAVIKVDIPKVKFESQIFNQLEKKYMAEELSPKESTEIAPSDFIEAAVRHCNMEIELGVNLIREYQALAPKISTKINPKEGENVICLLKLSNANNSYHLSINEYVKQVRQKYWDALFDNPLFTEGMTSNLRTKYREKVNELVDYDFSLHNIRMLQIEMSKNLISGIEECIIKTFDELSHEYSYNEDVNRNIHYYNGWKTNKAWYINKKVVLPYMRAFSDWNGDFRPTHAWNVINTLTDIEKSLDYLDGGKTGEFSTIRETFTTAEQTGQTRKIPLKYFDVTFYKKGTCHIEFKDLELLKKLNIFGSQQKGWLPQGYGKRKYKDFDKTEKEVIDSFEGQKEYNKVVENCDFYVYNPQDSLLKIGMTA